jgi:hypothetical protein
LARCEGSFIAVFPWKWDTSMGHLSVPEMKKAVENQRLFE